MVIWWGYNDLKVQTRAENLFIVIMLDKITIRNLWSQYVGMCRNFYWKISEILPTDSTYWSYLLIQPTDYRGILMRYIHEVYSWGMLITHEVYPCGILMKYTPEVNSWYISYILNLPTGPTYWFYLPIIEVYSWDILMWYTHEVYSWGILVEQTQPYHVEPAQNWWRYGPWKEIWML